MPNSSNNAESIVNNPDPVKLLNDLETLETDQKKWNYLRKVFLEDADLDEYIRNLDIDEELDLSRKQLTRLKSTLEGYRVYLQEYLEKTGARIRRFEAKLKQSVEDLANPDLTPEEVDKIAHTRKRVAQAMQIAKAPRGSKGKSLREVTLVGRFEAENPELNTKYQEFIENLGFSDVETEKLKEMVSDYNYQKAVEAAKELKASKIPTKAQILKELIKWTPEQLKNICETQEQPRVVIESDQSFDDQIAAMNENKHYTARNGNSQSDAYVSLANDTPYTNIPKSQKVKISITDGVIHPEQLKGVSARLGERRRRLTKEYAKKGMKLAGWGKMAALYQMSLMEAKETGDNGKIIDNCETGSGTVTILEQEALTKTALVAYSYFRSGSRQVAFNAYDPEFGNERARGRASVQVLEI
jgi:hypothetical protein